MHQRETARQKQHLQRQQGDHQGGLMAEAPEGPSPEQAVGHQGVEDLPGADGIGALQEGAELEIAAPGLGR